MRITIVGAGYVGLANAIMLAKKHTVTVLEVNPKIVEGLNRRNLKSDDPLLEQELREQNLVLSATDSAEAAYRGAHAIVFALPTDLNEGSGLLDTSLLEAELAEAVRMNETALLVIKSTVPVGFTRSQQKSFPSRNIIFCPEFLREGRQMRDCFHPERIVIGGTVSQESTAFANAVLSSILSKETPILYVSSCEAEAIKLFSNTYLAMRVAFFNELDSFAIKRSMSAQSIIDGMCLDSRIGVGYNNPSFGYGGYCLPKDVRQLNADFSGVPHKLIENVRRSNEDRKNVILEELTRTGAKVIGVYRLSAKSNAAGIRGSAVVDVAVSLRDRGYEVIVYEPTVNARHYLGMKIVSDLEDFKKMADLIICNRKNDSLLDVAEKVYTRDVYVRD